MKADELDLLKEANEIIRSFHAVIERKGATTNWDGLKTQVKRILQNQHKYLYPERYIESITRLDDKRLKEAMSSVNTYELIDSHPKPNSSQEHSDNYSGYDSINVKLPSHKVSHKGTLHSNTDPLQWEGAKDQYGYPLTIASNKVSVEQPMQGEDVLDMVNNDAKKRTDKVFDFVVKHKTDCYRAFKRTVSREGFKYPEGAELVKMARKEIGYSDKTWSGDIYNVLFNVYKSIVVDGKSEPKATVEQPIQGESAEEILKAGAILQLHIGFGNDLDGFYNIVIEAMEEYAKSPDKAIIAKMEELNKTQVEYITFLENDQNPYKIEAHNFRDELLKLEQELKELKGIDHK